MKLTVMIKRLKNSAGPSAADGDHLPAIFQCQERSFHMFGMFSIITMTPSIMAPMAMAMPLKDMMLALIPVAA